MLLWAGVGLIVLGLVCFAFDRKAARHLYAAFNWPFLKFMSRTTNLAKGAYWLTLACAVALISEIAVLSGFAPAFFAPVLQYALAYLAGLAAGSAVLHGLKLILCRRRPRDDVDFGLYGFLPFRFEWQYDSFPSGHALTIVCVAVIASCAWPQLAVLWFALALCLALSRALLTTHFFSDVFIGAGIGLIAAREAAVLLFPSLAPGWF